MKLSEGIKEFVDWKAVRTGVACRNYEISLQQFCIFTRNKGILEVTEQDVTEWFKLMLEAGYDSNSLISKGPALRALLTYFRRKEGFEKVLDPWLVPLPKQKVKFKVVKAEEEYEKLIACLGARGVTGTRDKAIVLMLVETGARLGELLSLNVGDIDLERKKAIVATEKTRGMRPIRELCWTERTNEALKAWMYAYPRSKEAPLFVSLSGAGLGNRMAHRAVEEVFKKNCRRAGIDNVHPHELRHRFGHQLAKKGVSSTMISNLMGHSSIQSSMRYTMMDNVEMRETYTRVFGE